MEQSAQRTVGSAGGVSSVSVEAQPEGRDGVEGREVYLRAPFALCTCCFSLGARLSGEKLIEMILGGEGNGV